jgi:hypothetical protein
MEQTRNNITNNQEDGSHRETALKRCLGKAFGITGPASNKAISASVFLFIGFLSFLAIWKTTGINWTRYAGAGCFLASLAACAIAFAAQTASQVIRAAEYKRAKVDGGKPREFKEEAPGFAKIIAKCFRASGRSKDNGKTCAKSYPVRDAAARAHTHNNARTYRRASRPSFAHASSSPEGEGSDGSGDSDPGDPPEQENHVTPPDSSEQPNRQHHPWRSPGMPWRSQRRRSA